MATTRPTRENPIAPAAAVLELAEQGLNSTEIAGHFGVSRQRISQILLANGVRPHLQQEARRAVNRRAYLKLKRQRAQAREFRYQQKQTRRVHLDDLAIELGVTANTLAQFTDCTGAYCKPTTRTGERRGNLLPNRWTPEGELLAQQVKAIAAPWSPRHIVMNREKAAW